MWRKPARLADAPRCPRKLAFSSCPNTEGLVAAFHPSTQAPKDGRYMCEIPPFNPARADPVGHKDRTDGPDRGAPAAVAGDGVPWTLRGDLRRRFSPTRGAERGKARRRPFLVAAGRAAFQRGEVGRGACGPASGFCLCRGTMARSAEPSRRGTRCAAQVSRAARRAFNRSGFQRGATPSVISHPTIGRGGFRRRSRRGFPGAWRLPVFPAIGDGRRPAARASSIVRRRAARHSSPALPKISIGGTT